MKTNTLFLLFIIFSTCVFGQNPFSITPTAGFSRSSMQPAGDLEQFLNEPDPYLRLTGGLNFNYDITENFFVSLGTHYMQRGSAYNDLFIPDEFLDQLTGGFGLSGININDFVEAEASFSINYIHLPLTAGYRFNINENISVFAQAGGFASIGLNGQTDGRVYSDFPLLSSFLDPEDQSQSGDILFEGDFRRVDLGLLAGAGIEVYGITLNFQYGYGLKSVVEDVNTAFFSGVPDEALEALESIDLDSRGYSRFITLQLGYRIVF